jgi:hypothetical protein
MPQPGILPAEPVSSRMEKIGDGFPVASGFHLAVNTDGVNPGSPGHGPEADYALYLVMYRWTVIASHGFVLSETPESR